MFAMTADMLKTAREAQAAHAAKEAGHRRDGGYSHEAYVDPTYSEKFCLHCEEYLGPA